MKVNIIESNGKKIKCEFYKKRNSKNINLRVDSFGIVKVSMPYYTPYIFGKNFVNKNIDWIEKKLCLSEIQKKSYNYLGNNIRLLKKFDADIQDFNYIFSNNTLTVYSNNKNYSEYDIYINWLSLKANEYIPKRVEELGKKYNFKYNSIKIKNFTSLWGSCSHKKNLSFNLKLMYFNYKVIDYVIIHELCHLKVMNHSNKFWNYVEGILPNYKEYRKQLNNNHI